LFAIVGDGSVSAAGGSIESCQ